MSEGHSALDDLAHFDSILEPTKGREFEALINLREAL
jgi:hypothetical protein